MVLVLALVGDCEDAVVGDTVPEDMDVGDGVGLVVRAGEELVVVGGPLLDATVVGTTLCNGSKRIWMITKQLTRMKYPKKTKTLETQRT